MQEKPKLKMPLQNKRRNNLNNKKSPKSQLKKKRKRNNLKKRKNNRKKQKNPLDLLPPSNFNLFDFKTLIVNAPDKKSAC